MSVKKSGVVHARAFHPLFPIPVDAADSDLSERDISWIYVFRNGDNAPKKFAAQDLTDEEQIVELYGGGQYTLRARDESKARWTAARELRLPGPSKPLHEAAQPIVTPAPPQTPMAEISSPGIRDALAVASVLGPLLLQWANASAQRAEAQTNLLISVVGKQNSGPNDQIMNALLQAQLQRNPGQEQFALMQQAMQMGMQLGAKGGGEEDTADLIEAYSSGMGNFVELERIKAQNKANQGPPKAGES